MYSDAILSVFSQRYSDARDIFIDKVETSSIVVDVEHIAHPLLGPKKDHLFCDVVWAGNKSADKVLVLVSGVHGVEGGLGSAIQSDFVSRHRRLPPDLCVVLIHAVNPWGFAWASRTDHEGIDVNRNFVDFDNLPSSKEALTHWESIENKKETISDFIKDSDKLDKLSQGQYEQKSAMYYGGESASWSRQAIEQVVTKLKIAKRKQVMVIDIHSGLGPYGGSELICEHETESVAANYAREVFGATVTEPLLGNSSSGIKYGLHDYYWQQQGEHVCFLTLEFGTYGTDKLLQALYDDHQLQQSGKVDWSDQQTLDIKHAMQDFFCPAEKQWQELILFRGRQVIEMAMEALSDTLNANGR